MDWRLNLQCSKQNSKTNNQIKKENLNKKQKNLHHNFILGMGGLNKKKSPSLNFSSFFYNTLT